MFKWYDFNAGMFQWSDFKDEYFLPGELAVAERIPFRCEVCTHVNDSPFSSRCGHTLCGVCVVKCSSALPVTECKTCGVCKGPNPNWSAAHSVAFQIKGLKIRCPKAPECEWKGTYSDFLNHANRACDRRSYKCLRQGCGQIVEVAKKEEHDKWCLTEREVKCEDCQCVMTCDELYNVHPDECQFVEVPCPQCDDGPFLRGELKSHIDDDCQMTDIRCPDCHHGPFKRLAKKEHEQTCPEAILECDCKRTYRRRDETDHFANKEFALDHLLLARSLYTELKTKTSRLEKEKMDLEKQLRERKGKRKREEKDEKSDEGQGSSRDDSNTFALKFSDVGALTVLIVIALLTAIPVTLTLAHHVNRWLSP